MSDQQKPAAVRLRPEVEVLIRGMNNASPDRSSIAALHFDGPVLADMVDVFVRLNPPVPSSLR